MRKLLLAAAAVALLAVATPAQAQQAQALCNERQCLGIKRCYYWSDYPTCIYPWPIIP